MTQHFIYNETIKSKDLFPKGTLKFYDFKIFEISFFPQSITIYTPFRSSRAELNYIIFDYVWNLL